MVFTTTGTAAAAAAAYESEAVLPGARGVIDLQYVSRTSANPVVIYVKDTAADGQHARARLVAWGPGGRYEWSWLTASGYNESNQKTTYATLSSGIERAAVEVCRFDGSVLKVCDYGAMMYNNYG